QDDWVYGMRLQNFDIDVFEQDPRQLPNFPDISGHVCYHQTSAPGLGTFTYNCTAPIVGRYVRLVLSLVDGIATLLFCTRQEVRSETLAYYIMSLLGGLRQRRSLPEAVYKWGYIL
ncbi:fucolectin-7, partial [Biomphalaria glabrata]